MLYSRWIDTLLANKAKWTDPQHWNEQCEPNNDSLKLACDLLEYSQQWSVKLSDDEIARVLLEVCNRGYLALLNDAKLDKSMRTAGYDSTLILWSCVFRTRCSKEFGMSKPTNLDKRCVIFWRRSGWPSADLVDQDTDFFRAFFNAMSIAFNEDCGIYCLAIDELVDLNRGVSPVFQHEWDTLEESILRSRYGDKYFMAELKNRRRS